ncbi:MAG: ABC transporter permease [Deltaproteobacteria bacterium]
MARRYLRLFAAQLRIAGLATLQYRADFFTDGVLSLFWLLVNLAPLAVVYAKRPTLAGWSFPEALVVIGWFTVLKGFLDGAINPCLTAIVEHIRKGTLDFVLLKPADAQFLVSTAKLSPWRGLDAFGGLLLLGYAFVRLHRLPSPAAIGAALLLLAAALALLYSLWILAVSAAFWVVRLDNLAFLFGSVFDAARWPVSVFRGGFRFLFTFVIPLAILTTYPALALLGRLDLHTGLAAVGGAFAFFALARLVWRGALGHYTSASS